MTDREEQIATPRRWQYSKPFARDWNMNHEVVQRKCRSGELPARKIGARWYIDLVALNQQLKEQDA